ncbi:homogentisate 1,2-dioxygenase [Thalassospira sp.]|uniref:homogentisate 1,2-dioxygenase n=1 Tax=Thalassospira sp. TaxID=1912094 RepID=UPI002735E01B|nr:homogentisate 1,2-dioxygenase [Thalassospira sp.]MDP2697300.1 homogentisate 1,2-dioxygenase [Thalassospira sp.]
MTTHGEFSPSPASFRDQTRHNPAARPQGEGGFEREMGREGFSGPTCHLRHRHPPTGWTSFEGPLRPRAYDLSKLAAGPSCPLQARRLMHSRSAEIRFWRLDGRMQSLVRNADGDMMIFVHNGQGHLYCDFGHMAFRDGDYLLIPRGSLWRLETEEPAEFLMVEATNRAFLLADSVTFTRPEIDDAYLQQQDEKNWIVHIKRESAISTLTYPFNPLDTVEWKGDLSVLGINWRDLRDRGSQALFATDRLEIGNFVRHPKQQGRAAARPAVCHSNDDVDELMFYHRGAFLACENIHPGMITFHPSGFPHGMDTGGAAGNHPASYDSIPDEEVVMMLDSRDMLHVDDTIPGGVEWKGYVHSW